MGKIYILNIDACANLSDLNVRENFKSLAEFVIPNNGQNDIVISNFLTNLGINPINYFWFRY